MSASAPAKTKAKAKPRRRTKTKAERAETSRQNSKKSTGPRTEEGKRNSSYNAVTHGLTARTVLLPGEDAGDLAARQQQLIDTFQPRHPVELAVIERMAGDIWRSDRAERGAARRISLRLRHEPLEQAKLENDEAITLGGRLFWQLAFPLPISKRFEMGKLTEPPCSETANAIHPHHPARIRLSLEQTIPGCEWLLDRWADLMRRLCRDQLWLSADAFKMVRLMGKHAIDMVDDLSVTSVFLSSLALLVAPKAGPEREAFDWKNALITMQMTFDVENDNGNAAMVAKQCEPFARRLAELPLAKLAPKNDEQAYENLTGMINDELRRLQGIRLNLMAIAQADEEEAPARLAFETGPEGDRQRRYGLSNERLVIRRFSQFIDARVKSATGLFDVDEAALQAMLGADHPYVEARAGIAPVGGVTESGLTESGVTEAGNAGLIAAGVENVTTDATLSNAAVFGESTAEASREDCRVDQANDGMDQEEVTVSTLAPRENVLSQSERRLCSDSMGREPSTRSEPRPNDGETLTPSPESRTSCDDVCILRNEASELVGGPSFVVSSTGDPAVYSTVPDDADLCPDFDLTDPSQKAVLLAAERAVANLRALEQLEAAVAGARSHLGFDGGHLVGGHGLEIADNLEGLEAPGCLKLRETGDLETIVNAVALVDV